MIIQYIIVGLIVGAAAFLVGKRLWPFRKKGHTGSCPGCSACGQINIPKEK